MELVLVRHALAYDTGHLAEIDLVALGAFDLLDDHQRFFAVVIRH